MEVRIRWRDVRFLDQTQGLIHFVTCVFFDVPFLTHNLENSSFLQKSFRPQIVKRLYSTQIV